MPRQKRDFPWVEAEPNGVFYVHWYDERSQRTKRRSLGTRDKTEAQDRFAQFLVHGVDVMQPERPSELTVRQAVDDYIREHVRKKTVRQPVIENSLAWVVAFFGDTPLKDIGVPQCERYADARRSGVLTRPDSPRSKPVASDGTIRLELAYLSAAARHSAKWQRISRANLPELQMPPQPRPRQLFLYPDELRKLRDHATGRAAAFIELAYYTGSRRGAIEALTWFQVDLDKGRINLAKPGEQRTNKRRPVVPIDPALRPTLLRLKKEATNEYVLGSTSSIDWPLYTAARAAGLDTLPEREQRPAGRLGPHVLRHTRATHLLWAGKAPWAVAQLLGDSLDTILANYGHHCPGYLSEVLGDQEEN